MRLTWGLSLFAATRCWAQGQSSGQVKFEKDVLPIFTQYCFGCHGKTSPQLGLDLRTAHPRYGGARTGR